MRRRMTHPAGKTYSVPHTLQLNDLLPGSDPRSPSIEYQPRSRSQAAVATLEIWKAGNFFHFTGSSTVRFITITASPHYVAALELQRMQSAARSR